MRIVMRALALLVLCAVVTAGCAAIMGDSIDALMKQGIDLFTAHRYDEAIPKFLEVVRRDPKSWSAYLYLARAYIGKHSWGDAIASAKKALELAPGNAEVVSTLADAFLGGGASALERRQLQEALSDFGEYVKLRPTDWRGYLDLGRALLGSGAYGDALRAFIQGLGHAPDSPARGQLVRGLLDGGAQALSAGQPAAAVDLLSEYVRHDPGNVSAYVNLGKAYWQTGQIARALAAFRRALELDPNDAEARRFLGGD